MKTSHKYTKKKKPTAITNMVVRGLQSQETNAEKKAKMNAELMNGEKAARMNAEKTATNDERSKKS